VSFCSFTEWSGNAFIERNWQLNTELRGPFEKFLDSPYYSESELCGGAVTVFFEVPPLASDAHLTTLHPLLENVLQTVCRKLQEDSGTGGFDSWSLWVLRSLFMVSLHRLHRLDGWVLRFLIHFFQAERRIQSLNTPLKKCLSCSAKVSEVRNIIRVIRSRRMRWAGHRARMEQTRNAILKRVLLNRP
jgi:hypothetical protein